MSNIAKSDNRQMGVALKRSAMVMVFSVLLLLLTLSVVGAKGPFYAPAAPNVAPDIRLAWVVPTANQTVVPGESTTYRVGLRNVAGANGAASGVLTITLPLQMDMGTVTSSPSGGVVVSNSVRWELTNVVNTTAENYEVMVRLPNPAVAHDALLTHATSYFTSTDGIDEDLVLGKKHYVIGPEIDTTVVTSIATGVNDIGAAVAGEIVTTTVVYNILTGTVAYGVLPRIALEDGLESGSAQPAIASNQTGTRANLDPYIPSAIARGTLLGFSAHTVLTGPHTLTYTVVATRTQAYFIGTTAGTDIVDNYQLNVIPLLRWCDAPGCSVDDTDILEHVARNYAPADTIYAIRPDINSAVTYQFGDAGGIGAGGGPIELGIINENTGRATAYDSVISVTCYLSYTHVTPMYSGVFTNADPWIFTWTVPALAPDASWPITIYAELPSSFAIGTEFLALETTAYQETFAGDVVDEGHYLDNVFYGLIAGAGLAQHKESDPPAGSNIRMGDLVSYTVTFTQAANTSMPEPYYEDILPLGFHLSDTVTIQGGAVLTGPAVSTKGPVVSGLYKDQLSWYMESLTPTGSTRVIVANYTVRNTGLDYDGYKVYNSAPNLKAAMKSDNSVTLHWNPPDGILVDDLPIPAESKPVYVIQPYFGTNNVTTQRLDAGDREVGELVRFELTFKNTGKAAAYELEVCDQLPLGLGLDTQIPIVYAVGDAGKSNVSAEPAVGDNKLCWTIKTVPANATYRIEYHAKISDVAMMGMPLVNTVSLQDYTSLPGASATERSYADIDAAIPKPPAYCADPAVGCLTVVGLAVNKLPWQTTVMPSDLVTYTLMYSDTNPSKDYLNVVLTDTFDTSLVAFISADPAPTMSSTHQLMWEVIPVTPTGATRNITLTMQVKDVVPDGVEEIVNTLLWSSDEIPQHSITRAVELQASSLNVIMTAPTHTHASATVVYTVAYNNTGLATSLVTLTLDYGDYTDFLATSAISTTSTNANPVLGTNNVFTDIIGSGDGNRSFTIDLQVKTPLPYDLASLQAAVEIESRGANSKSASVDLILDRPVFNLRKEGPLVANAVGNKMEYLIYIRNDGSYTATGILITDTWGLHQDYVADNHARNGWFTSTAGTYVTQTVMDLGIGQSLPMSIKFEVMVAETATAYTNTVELGSDQTTTQAETESVWQATIATSKAATPVPAFPGRIMTYTVYYTNTSTLIGNAMNDAFITDTLPAGFVYQGYDDSAAAGCSGWVFTPPGNSGGGDAEWYCAYLDNGKFGEFQIWGEVMTATEGTVFTNTVATSANLVPVRIMEGEHLVTRVARPWLRVDKTVAPTHPVAPGDQLTYTLTYENYGTDPAYNVVIADELPTTQVEYQSCPGVTCTHDSGIVTWTIANVPVGTVATVEVVVTVRADTGGQSAVNSDYTIKSDRLPTAETISGAATSSPILDPHLSVAKDARPPYITAKGDLITYTIVYTNDGGGTLTNAVITDAIALATIVEQTSLSANCSISGTATLDQVVTCELGNLGQGTRRQVQFVVYVGGNPAERDTFENIAYGSSEQTQSTATNKTTVLFSPDGCVPPYDVNFTVSENPLAGEIVTFTGSARGDNTITYTRGFTWTFGDSSATKIGKVVTHTYAFSNTYIVKLTVDNACMDSESTSKAVFVPGEPDIAVAPVSLAQTAVKGTTDILSDTLTVTNSGTAQLSWNIEISPAATSWLSISVASGNITPAAQTDVTLFYDPASLTVGSYGAEVLITSNAPDASPVVMPVALEITPASVCEPVTGADFNFTPANPFVDDTVNFTATLTPPTSTTPLTYTWDFGRGPSSPVSSSTLLTSIYAFTTEGTQPVTFTVWNCAPTAAVDRTRTVTVKALPTTTCQISLTAVAINGPGRVSRNTPATFNAVITPVNATPPLTYTWSPAPLTGQGTATTTYQLPDPGFVMLTLTITNCAASFSTQHLVVVPTAVVINPSPEITETLIYTSAAGFTTTLEIPYTSVSSTSPITIVYTPILSDTSAQDLPTDLKFAGRLFDLSAFQDGEEVNFKAALTLTVYYNDDIAGLSEASLRLYSWDELASSGWKDATAACSPSQYDYVRDLKINKLSIRICHLSWWQLLGQHDSPKIYLPLILRN